MRKRKRFINTWSSVNEEETQNIFESSIELVDVGAETLRFCEQWEGSRILTSFDISFHRRPQQWRWAASVVVKGQTNWSQYYRDFGGHHQCPSGDIEKKNKKLIKTYTLWSVSDWRKCQHRGSEKGSPARGTLNFLQGQKFRCLKSPLSGTGGGAGLVRIVWEKRWWGRGRRRWRIGGGGATSFDVNNLSAVLLPPLFCLQKDPGFNF